MNSKFSIQDTSKNLCDEIKLVSKLLHRNKNQHRKQSFLKNILQVIRIEKLCPLNTVSKFFDVLSETIIATQQKVSVQGVNHCQVVITDAIKILDCLLEICLTSEKAGIHLLMQLRNGVFGPLYSVILASCSKILHLTSKFVTYLYDQITFLTHYLKHISAIKPQYAGLINLSLLDISSHLTKPQYDWLQTLNTSNRQQHQQRQQDQDQEQDQEQYQDKIIRTEDTHSQHIISNGNNAQELIKMDTREVIIQQKIISSLATKKKDNNHINSNININNNLVVSNVDTDCISDIMEEKSNDREESKMISNVMMKTEMFLSEEIQDSNHQINELSVGELYPSVSMTSRTITTLNDSRKDDEIIYESSKPKKSLTFHNSLPSNIAIIHSNKRKHRLEDNYGHRVEDSSLKSKRKKKQLNSISDLKDDIDDIFKDLC